MNLYAEQTVTSLVSNLDRLLVFLVRPLNAIFFLVAYCLDLEIVYIVSQNHFILIEFFHQKLY